VDDKLIGTVSKTSVEEIRVALREFRGRCYLDVRTYYFGDDGEWHPTKKGVTVGVAGFQEFYALVKKASRELARGEGQQDNR